MGIKGIRVNKKIIEGNTARKKLKAVEDALELMSPFLIPCINTFSIGPMLKPSKKKTANFLDIEIIELLNFEFCICKRI